VNAPAFAEAAKDPVVAEVLEVFRGRVVKVVPPAE
jgi:hypothetical protein